MSTFGWRKKQMEPGVQDMMGKYTPWKGTGLASL